VFFKKLFFTFTIDNIHSHNIFITMRKLILVLFLISFSSPIKADYWTQKANFAGLNRADATGFAIGNKCYIGTGYIGVYATDWWEYDPITDVWTQKANYGGSGIIEAVSFAIGSRGYVLSSPSGNDFWQYDPSANTWAAMDTFPGSQRQAAVAFAIDNKGYITTGLYTTSMADLWEYDPATDSWLQKSSLPGPARHYACGFSIGTSGYIGTGTNFSSGNMNDFWQWDQATDAWTQMANVPGPPRIEASAFAVGGFGYIGMGSNAGNYYSDFYQYDPVNNTWTQKANFIGGPREEATQFAMGQFGFVGTGYDGVTSGVMKNDFWEYHPEDSTTNVQELSLNQNMNIFPNPMQSETTISFQQELLSYKPVLQIWDANGKLVKKIHLTKNECVLSRGSLNSGNYKVRLIGEKNVIATRSLIVIE